MQALVLFVHMTVFSNGHLLEKGLEQWMVPCNLATNQT